VRTAWGTGSTNHGRIGQVGGELLDAMRDELEAR
jgi:hypothetical protein